MNKSTQSGAWRVENVVFGCPKLTNSSRNLGVFCTYECGKSIRAFCLFVACAVCPSKQTGFQLVSRFLQDMDVHLHACRDATQFLSQSKYACRCPYLTNRGKDTL